MSIDFDQLGKKLHVKLDNGIDQLKKAKNQLEDLQKETEAAIQSKLSAAKETMEKEKQKAASAKEKIEAFVKAKTAETETMVAEWKTNHDRKKLEKRAERAEKYAESSADLALYYASEAEVAILEAVAARQDADDAA